MSRAAILVLTVAVMTGAGAQPAPGAKPWDAWQPPEVVLPNPNAFDLYLKAFDLKSQLDRQFPREEGDAGPGVPDPWGEGPANMPVADRVLLYGDVLKTVREALPLECLIPPPAGVESLLPHFLGFRQVARLFAMEAEARRLDGDYAGAAASALDCFEMAQDAKSQDILISYLVGVACEAIALASLDETTPHLKADEAKAALARLQSLVAIRRPLQMALDGERVFGCKCFKQLVADPVRLRESLKELIEEPLSDAEADKIIARLPQTWQAMEDYYALLRRNAGLPYPQRAQSLAPPPGDALLEAMVPNIAPVLLRDVAASTQADLRVLALAAQAYRAEHGEFPPELASLVPGIIAAVPVDPFTGGSLSALIRNDKLVLYSFGPDGVDNGGTPTGKQVKADSKGDIVLELNLSPRP